MKLKIILSILIVLILFIGVGHATVNQNIGWHPVGQIARTGTTGIDNGGISGYVDYAEMLWDGSAWGPDDFCQDSTDYNCADRYYQRNDADFYIDYSN
ncbi:hypothetical protein ACFLQN_02190, partial [Candidatus Aenigmatarchaeota archaeon]